MSAHGESVCPEVVLASIAWYPDELSDERRGLVEAHAAGCQACRNEIAFVQGANPDDVALPDPGEVYARVMARIEHSEGLARGGVHREIARAPVRERAVPRRAALAAGIALALAFGAAGVVSGRWLERAALPVYTAAGEQVAAPAAAGGPILDVVFRKEAPADAIHAALRAIGGQVESGPTQIGVYRVRLGPAADAAAAARVLRGDVGGGASGVASFAEPAPR